MERQRKRAVCEKRRLWKSWNQKGGSKEEYLTAKRTAKREFYLAIKAAEVKKFSDLWSCLVDIFKIAKQMRKNNQDIPGDKCV